MSLLSELAGYLPKWFWLAFSAVIILILTYLAYPLYESRVTDSRNHINSSYPSFYDKFRAAKQYVRYSYRSFRYDGDSSNNPPIIRNRAMIKGLDKDGRIHLTVYTNKGMIATHGSIADVDIKDLLSANALIKSEAKKAVVVDTYRLGDENHFVIWLEDGTPLNETLITNMIASPIDSPPTNIVNSLFKEHYRTILLSK